MLVFFSDVHLTDGTSGETINEEAFERFVDQIGDLAEKRRAEEVRVVLLGDGLDIIRSDRWLDGRGGTRPWSPPGGEQRRRGLDILSAILDNNRRAVETLREMPYRIAARSRVPYWRVHFDYVLGNHDWLIDRYRATRQLVAGALGLSVDYVQRGFPFVYTSPPDEYDVMARHADIHDRLNYDETLGRDASSYGDAIVVELLNRFPLEVERGMDGDPGGERIVRRLKEVDNVRPYEAMASWVAEVLTGLDSGHPMDRTPRSPVAEDAASSGPERPVAAHRTAQVAREALKRCLRDFTEDETIQAFARRQLSWLERLYARMLLYQMARRRVSCLDFWSRMGERLYKGWQLLRNQPGSRYAAKALLERHPDGQVPRFVVYGHSHRVESVPLGPYPRGGDRFYLNTGTWRSIWRKARTEDGRPHFASWKEMSYVVVYSPHEASGTHEFEIWTGSLRDRGKPAPHRRSRPPVRPERVRPGPAEMPADEPDETLVPVG